MFMIESFFVFASTYLISYFILSFIQIIYQKINPITFSKIKKNVWMKLYCILTLLCVHYVWFYCRKFYPLRCGYHSYFIIPFIVMIPIYILFIQDYYEYRFVIEDKENEKWNRILAHIFVLLFLFQFVFYYLSKKMQQKVITVVESFFLFEII
jgi:hypothetical protein